MIISDDFSPPPPGELNLLLADDDMDDCLFFKEALEELQVSAHLTTVHDGEELMQLLQNEPGNLPDAVFLDLNMPRKTGFTCLEEIKGDERLKQLPVVIFSTSFERDVADVLYKKGAHFYICKPAAFSNLKKVIHQALTLIAQSPVSQPSKEKFFLNNLE